MSLYLKPRFVIQVRTGDKEPLPEWMDLYSDGRTYRFVDRWDAERALDRLRRFQPHAELRIAPLPE